MPFYRVIVRQDAWLNHEGYVEAENAERAAELALAAWKGNGSTLDVPLKPTGEREASTPRSVSLMIAKRSSPKNSRAKSGSTDT
jgi:hypothetical protein